MKKSRPVYHLKKPSWIPNHIGQFFGFIKPCVTDWSAQCTAEDLLSFQDIERHHYFNTNNLWVDLDKLAERIDASPDGLPLPVIQNTKTIEPDVEDGPRCLQLETAMGAAIECFEVPTPSRATTSRSP